MERAKPGPSLPASIGIALVLIAVLIAAVYALVHSSVRPIRPDQKAPSGHVTYRCSLCHTISEDAPRVGD